MTAFMTTDTELCVWVVNDGQCRLQVSDTVLHTPGTCAIQGGYLGSVHNDPKDGIHTRGTSGRGSQDVPYITLHPEDPLRDI